MKQGHILLGIIVVSIAVGVLYYFLFFTPYAATRDILREENEVLRIEHDFAQQLALDFHNAQVMLANIEESWAEATADLPMRFDDIDVLNRIQTIIYPYTQQLSVIINPTEQRFDTLWSTVLQVHFISNYSGFLSVLDGLASDDIDNRIINYNINIIERPLSTNDSIILEIILYIEYISQLGDALEESEEVYEQIN